MTNQIFPIYKQQLFASFASGKNYRVAGIDTTKYTFVATDSVLADIPPAAIVRTSQLLTNLAVVDGVLLVDEEVMLEPGIVVAPIDAFLVYQDLGNPEMNKLLMFIDNLPGFPFGPSDNTLSLLFPGGLVHVV